MAFVKEKFTPECSGRSDFGRDLVAFSNPAHYWAIDGGGGIFLRMVRPSGGDNFDPVSGLENHFHRYGYSTVKYSSRETDSNATLYKTKEKRYVIEMK